MTWKGIKHNSVGAEMTSVEFHSDELHEIEKGDELPETGNEGDFYFNTADGHLYIWKN